MTGFNYAVFAPLIDTKYRLGLVPYTHIIALVNLCLTYIGNIINCPDNPDNPAGMTGPTGVTGESGPDREIYDYIYDIKCLVIDHCIQYIQHNAALRIGVESNTNTNTNIDNTDTNNNDNNGRYSIYSFDTISCNDYSILRHIVSVLHQDNTNTSGSGNTSGNGNNNNGNNNGNTVSTNGNTVYPPNPPTPNTNTTPNLGDV